MLSVRPKVAELVFQLYGRTLHPELFEINREQHIQRGEYKATIQITNSGHVICWQVGGLILTEVAASAHQPLPEKRRLMSHPFRGECSDGLECRGGAKYKTSFSIARVEPKLFQAYQMQIKLAGPKMGLVHEFDASGRIGVGAISYVHTESRDRSLKVRALHTFPDDFAIVKSESTFLLP